MYLNKVSGLPLGPPFLLRDIIWTFQSDLIEDRSSLINAMKQKRIHSQIASSDESKNPISFRSSKSYFISSKTRPMCLCFNLLVFGRGNYFERFQNVTFFTVTTQTTQMYMHRLYNRMLGTITSVNILWNSTKFRHRVQI